MSGEHINKPLLVVIYPYKFTDFVYEKIELDYFKRYCEVCVWDISPITTPNFAKVVITERSKSNDVTVLSSLLDFIRCVYELRKRLVEANIYIVNEVYSNSLSEFICNLIISAFLRTKNVTIIEYCNGGVPVKYPCTDAMPAKLNHLGFLSKAMRFIKGVSTFSEAKKTIISVSFQRLGHLLVSSATHRLVAGEDYLAIAQVKFRSKKRIQLVYGHSEDYSNNLLHELNSSPFVIPHNKIAVYLDGPGPMFMGDAVQLGRKICFTSDVWYPALCHFFDRVEAETAVRIVIAGHYKSVHPALAPYFGNRHIYYGKTRELVRNSEFVITRASTATSYAVIFRKPVISIYSNQLNEDYFAMHDIRGMAAVLGNIPININDNAIEINSLLKVKEARYIYYEKACLTSATSKRPNCQIILEDVMNIATGTEFFSENL